MKAALAVGLAFAYCTIGMLGANFRSPDIGIHTNVRFSVRFHSFQPHLRQAGIADSFGSPSQGQIHWAIRSVAYRSRPCRIWNPKMPEKKSGQFWVPAPSIGNPIKMRSSKLYVRSSELRQRQFIKAANNIQPEILLKSSRIMPLILQCCSRVDTFIY